MGRTGGDNAPIYSLELCGGTHVASTGDIGLFKVVNEGAVSSGVRRIEALTGDAARRWFEARDEKLREPAAVLKASPDEVPPRVAAVFEGSLALERALAHRQRA